MQSCPSTSTFSVQVNVVDDRLIVLPINRPIVGRQNRPIPIIGFSQSIGRYFQTKTWIFKKKKIGETVKKLNKKIDKVFFPKRNTLKNPKMHRKFQACQFSVQVSTASK